jgi:hypothetical protein
MKPDDPKIKHVPWKRVNAELMILGKREIIIPLLKNRNNMVNDNYIVIQNSINRIIKRRYDNNR